MRKLLFVLYGATGPIRKKCADFFCDNGFSAVAKLNYTEAETHLVARYGDRKFVSADEFAQKTDFSYKIENITVGFDKQQIIDAVRGEKDRLLTLSTDNLEFITELKSQYGEYVTVIFLYIDESTLKETMGAYEGITEEELSTRLSIAEKIKKCYVYNTSLFDYSVMFGGEKSVMNYDMLFCQFKNIIKERKKIEKKLNDRRYVELPYSGPDNYLFISYSREDKATVQKVMWRLQREGYRIWYDDGIQAGINWRKVLDRKIANAKEILLFSSKYSTVSENVEAEINAALYYKRRIIDIKLDETRFEGFEMYISLSNFLRYNDPDFYNKLTKAVDKSTKACME